jgi:ubiquinol-cytochrome c reductase cytochrome b subunit
MHKSSILLSTKRLAGLSKKGKVGINQQEMLNSFNISINNKLREHNSSSETTRVISFNEWLGGLMDSDGSFSLSKLGYLSCEITLGVREVDSLYKIKKKFGGSVTKRSNVQTFRWRLHNRDLLRPFLESLNGHIYVKSEQYEKIMKLYLPNTSIKSISLESSEAWLSGFFEGDGYVNINSIQYQISISISQKKLPILDKLRGIYGGNIHFDKSWNGYTWQISNKEELIKMFEYFTLYPLKSKKNADLVSAMRFFRYKLLDYHLDDSRKDQLNHFIKLFQKRKKI